VRANEKQVVFTGKQQRDGVAIVPFILAGLFGRLGDDDADDVFVSDHEAERAVAEAATDVAAYDADGDDDAAAMVSKNFVFDWAAYKEEWGDTPVHVSVTSLSAEYAVLYARIAGRATSAVPPPMTMTEGHKIAAQAKDFVNKFVTPISGHIASVKVHKLLCHVADAIKWQGNFRNDNTADNESEHKVKKPFYARTNKNARTFTRQLVRHSHGAWGILARHTEDDKAAVAAWRAKLAARAATAAAAEATRDAARDALAAGGRATAAAGAAVGAAPAPGGGVVAAVTSAAASAAAAAAVAAASKRARKQKLRVYNVARVSVGDFARRPDLANVWQLLNMVANRNVRVATRTSLQARFECGTRVQQQLRAAEDYLGAPWHEAVLYHFGGDEARLCVGELRAIVRGRKGDAFVLVPMEAVAAEELCPFAARDCVRLKWRTVNNATDLTLRFVPVEHVRRLAFVVPDFADLAARRGVDADLPSMDSPLTERLDALLSQRLFSLGFEEKDGAAFQCHPHDHADPGLPILLPCNVPPPPPPKWQPTQRVRSGIVALVTLPPSNCRSATTRRSFLRLAPLSPHSGQPRLDVWVRPCGDCRSSALPQARRTTYPKAH